MKNKCPLFSSQLNSSRKDHIHQYSTETGATDTRDQSRSPFGALMTNMAKRDCRKKILIKNHTKLNVMTGFQMNI